MTEKQEKTRKPRETTYEELVQEVASLKGSIETRGVSSQGVQPHTGLDLASIHQNVSWKDIQDQEPKQRR